ncbi:MAG TPA: hypothetical protein ENK23_05345 [Sorangium sp.]|nr:hypothetical protein [Sorangium sp.]
MALNSVLLSRQSPPPSLPAATAQWPPPFAPPPDEGAPAGTSAEMAAAVVSVLEQPAATAAQDPLEGVARVVRERVSGCVRLESDDGERVRRVMFRDGDMVNALSDVADEGLLFFLAERGDVTREIAALRAKKWPHSGRRAAAALIANGYLGQDDLWPVLRAHAEWVVVRALRDRPAHLALEETPPERLSAEPNVFGGAAGVEVFIELVRRVVSPQDAAQQLLKGNEFLVGARHSLLAESALEGEELLVARAAAPAPVVDVLARHAQLAPLLLALVRLEIWALAGLPAQRAASAAPARHSGYDPLDVEALRQRVEARLALVREADYFQLLGVSTEATPYDIKRAFLTLRRQFEPSRLLTPATADLSDEVALIVEVLEEAYAVLRDPHRRRRYRAALLATG